MKPIAKKLLSVMLALQTVVPTFLCGISAVSSCIAGDVNADGKNYRGR